MLRTRPTMVPALAAALVLATAPAIGACGDSSGTGPGEADAGQEAGMQQVDVEREAAAPDAPVGALVDGLNGFTVELARNASGNVVVSPTSIAVTFAMAGAGADDSTAAQIGQAFGFPDGPGLHEAVNALTLALQDANRETDDGEVVLELANAIWAQQGLEVGEAFLETTARHYGTGVRTTDFGDPPASRDLINGWVAERTRDRIPELVPQGMITPQTMAMLVNAIYMKAPWSTTFSEGATSDEPFTLADGSTVDVPTMHDPMLGASVAQGALGGVGYTAVDLPYEGRDLAMTVVVPDEGAPLADLEGNLDGGSLAEITGGLSPATVDLALPRWDTESALDLAEVLGPMGVPVPGGDLSGIAPGVFIGGAVHAADITVDEEGTEAAAATAVMGTTSAPSPDEVVTVRVDRPFLFLVRHVETGAPLFYGRVANPAS